MSDLVSEKERVLRIAFNSISENYPSEMYEWLRIYDPETSHMLSDLEDRINANLMSNGSMTELMEILEAYKKIDTKLKNTFNENRNPTN